MLSTGFSDLSIKIHGVIKGPLTPDYALSSHQLYCRVIAHMKGIDSLRGWQAKEKFYDRLREALHLNLFSDWEFRRIHHLYEFANFSYTGRHCEPNPEYEQTHLLQFGSIYLELSAECLANRPIESYNRFVQYLQLFPREEDSQAWGDFETLVRYALGLTNLDPSIMLFPLEPPELVNYADEYARTRIQMHGVRTPRTVPLSCGFNACVSVTNGSWNTSGFKSA